MLFFVVHNVLHGDKIQMDEKIDEIIKLYNALTGRNIIPKNTDPKRTYQYRYAAKFMKNMEGVSWETIKKIVYYAVEYASENRKKSVWTRGLWILTKSNIIVIAYEKSKEEDRQRQLYLDKVIKSKKFAEEHNYEFSKTKTEGGFPNIVTWYDSGEISLTYLAMSESCKKALTTIDETDRRMIPDQKEIIRRRIRCLMDKDYREKLKNTLGSDYIKIT